MWNVQKRETFKWKILTVFLYLLKILIVGIRSNRLTGKIRFWTSYMKRRQIFKVAILRTAINASPAILRTFLLNRLHMDSCIWHEKPEWFGLDLTLNSKGNHKCVTRNQIYVSCISISDFIHCFTGLSRGIFTMIEVIGSAVSRLFFAEETVSVHVFVLGHKHDYWKYRTCFDLRNWWTKGA